MKPIQITLDERLLARLDADSEVRRHGRSAVRRRRKRTIASQYAKAYGAEPGLGAEFSGWEDEGSWPAQ